jgi:prevent-host-death family protein
MKLANVRELKAKTSEMLRTVEKGNTVLVTTHGRPTAMLIPATEENLEDILLSYSPKLRKKIEAGLRDIRAGRTIALSDYIKKQRPKRTKK